MKRILSIGAVGAAIALAGCGTKAGGGSASQAAPAPDSTVTARQVSGVGTALTDPAGKTLYFADQEADGSIHCVDACLRFWMPLTVSTGTTPTAGGGVTGALSTVNRADGSTQVTYNGKPLYTFAEDKGPGSASGNGFKDSFGGTNFSWHAAATSGAAPTGGTSTNGNYGYGYGN